MPNCIYQYEDDTKVQLVPSLNQINADEWEDDCEHYGNEQITHH